MIKNNERPEMPDPFVLLFLLTTEEINEQTKQVSTLYKRR